MGFLSTSLIIHSRKEHNSCEMTSEADIFKQRAASTVKRVHESSPCFICFHVILIDVWDGHGEKRMSH